MEERVSKMRGVLFIDYFSTFTVPTSKLAYCNVATLVVVTKKGSHVLVIKEGRGRVE
jgi:hypothetical protein